MSDVWGAASILGYELSQLQATLSYVLLVSPSCHRKVTDVLSHSSRRGSSSAITKLHIDKLCDTLCRLQMMQQYDSQEAEREAQDAGGI